MTKHHSIMPVLKSETEVLSLLDGFLLSRAFMVATELGVFQKLWHQPMLAEQLVSELKLPRRSGIILLNGCLAAGLLGVTDEGIFFVPEHLAPFLVKEASKEFQMVQYLADFYKDVFVDFSNLKSLIESDGETSSFTRRDYFKDKVEDVPAEIAREYSDYMAMTMRVIAEVALESVDLSRATHATDLCGGPGTFAISLFQKYPHLQVEFVDVPSVAQIGQKALEEQGLGAIRAVGADAFQHQLPSGTDLVTMCRAAHDWSDSQCEKLFASLGTQLGSGARFVIIERMLPENYSADAKNLYVRSLYFLSKSTSAQYRRASQYAEMLRKAGFSNIEVVEPVRVPYAFFRGLRILVATR